MSQNVFQIKNKTMRRADQLYREITAGGDPFLSLTNEGKVKEYGNRFDVVNSEGFFNFLNIFRNQFCEFSLVDSVRRAKCIYKSLGERERREFLKKWTQAASSNYTPTEANFNQTYANFPQGLALAFEYHLGDQYYQRNTGGDKVWQQDVVPNEHRNWTYNNKAAWQNFYNNYAAQENCAEPMQMNFTINWDALNSGNEAEDKDFQEPVVKENETYQELPQDKLGSTGPLRYGGQRKRLLGKRRAKKPRHNDSPRPIEKVDDDLNPTENAADISSAPNPYLSTTQLQDLGFQNYFKMYVAHHPFEPDDVAVLKATSKYAALSPSKKERYMKYGENPSIFFEATDAKGQEHEAGDSKDFCL